VSALDDFEAAIDQDHRATNALMQGDPEPKKRMFSRRDDVTLANPFGPPARGRNQVEETLDRAASQLRDGEPIRYERISKYATAEVAYILEIERNRVKIDSSDEMAPVSLRATTIYRREDGGWRIVHRHADPITSPRPMESVIQS
jgi:ketosteroid isomerase-like protein